MQLTALLYMFHAWLHATPACLFGCVYTQYEEFIAATLPPVVVQRSEILRGAFKVQSVD
jgi:hypothetical protein